MAEPLDYEPRTPTPRKLTGQIVLTSCTTGIAVAALAFQAKQIFDDLTIFAPCTGFASVLFGGIAAWSCLTVRETPQPAIIKWMFWLDVSCIGAAIILMVKAMEGGD
jgi:hypothetical protein